MRCQPPTSGAHFSAPCPTVSLGGDVNSHENRGTTEGSKNLRAESEGQLLRARKGQKVWNCLHSRCGEVPYKPMQGQGHRDMCLSSCPSLLESTATAASRKPAHPLQSPPCPPRKCSPFLINDSHRKAATLESVGGSQSLYWSKHGTQPSPKSVGLDKGGRED